jgi:hypothetical protein
LPNRLAVEDEKLVVHRFRTGSTVLTSPHDLRPLQVTRQMGFWHWLGSIFDGGLRVHGPAAVCVPPGARLLLKDIPDRLQRRWRVDSREDVLFVQRSEIENDYRDGVQFFNGRQILLQELPAGMRVRVLSLGGIEFGDGMQLAFDRDLTH